MFVCISFLYFLIMSYDTVEMIKEFPQRIACRSLSAQGDVVYIASLNCIIQWNVVSDAAMSLDGYHGLIQRAPLSSLVSLCFQIGFMPLILRLVVVSWLEPVSTF